MHIDVLFLFTAQLNGALANHAVGGNSCDWSQCAAALWSLMFQMHKAMSHMQRQSCYASKGNPYKTISI